MTASLARLLCLALVCAAPVYAAPADELFEEHHAHEHGVATLEVAVAALEHVEVRLLEQLVPDLKLEVQVASPEGQHSAELTRSNARLVLRKLAK